MREALRLGRQAAEEGEVPVGALVVDAEGRVLGRGRNRREAAGDPLAHAEVEAMRAAAQAMRERRKRQRGTLRDDDNAADDPADDPAVRSHAGDASMPFMSPVPAAARAAERHTSWNLADCTLVVTLEPCPMCAGAALQAHVGRIVFGAWDAKLGACGSVWDIPRDPHIGPHPEVVGGVEEEACMALLRDFFRTRRR
ncbi:nucleoside deaminase [Bifidobacterium subtile]|nr:nucleoside deaminase [Bifidobacterium subtile]